MDNLEEKKSKIDFSKLATLITMITPVLFAFGYFYDTGYLSGFGISSEYFPRSIQFYLIEFLYVFILFLSKVINFSIANYGWFFLSVIGVGFLYYIIYLIVQLKIGEEFITKLKVFKNKSDKNKNILQGFEYILSGIVTFVIGNFLVAILASILLIIVAPINLGKSIAKTQIEKYVDCDSPKEPKGSNCVYIYKDKNKVLSGLLITKSEKYIAVWNGKQSVIYPLADEIIIVEKLKDKEKRVTK